MCPAPVNPNKSDLDQTQILQRVMDEATDRLRTDAAVSIVGDVTVDIDAATGDNIAIANADGSKKVTVTTIGLQNGLDTNIIGGEVNTSNTLITEPFDYISASYPSPNVEVYTYRFGGSGGSIVGVITASYTDATKQFITNVAKV